MPASFLRHLFGSKNSRELRRISRIVNAINSHGQSMAELDDAALAACTAGFRRRLEAGESVDNLLPEAFAVVREAGSRMLGLRHFDVQMVGGIALHEGKISEMRTGEGKTLVATLPAYLNALAGKSTHIVTVNDYLARRDAHWMGPLYAFLGVQVAVVHSMVEGEANSFLYSVDAAEGHERFPHLHPCERKQCYEAQVVYGTNNEFGFDYLRNNMVLDASERLGLNLDYAIVDEVDSILIDEARTPLVISGGAEDSSALYGQVDQVVRHLEPSSRVPQRMDDPPPDGDFVVDEKQHSVDMTEQGHQRIEKLMLETGLLAGGDSLYAANNLGLLSHVQNALRAGHLYKRDVDYIVQDGGILLIDEHTGRKMPGRRLSEGLHQAIEAKEGLQVQSETQTLASITFQNYFRLYDKLSGMTGTADTEASEFHEIYRLPVLVIPTNQPIARLDDDDRVYLTRAAKHRAVVADIKGIAHSGAPVLVGTISIDDSEVMSRLLREAGVEHQVLNAKYHESEAAIIAAAGEPGRVTIATNMAGRGTDIVLGGNLDVELAGLDDEARIAPQKADWQKRHDRVIEAGGLHVIGTERHESRRIDNQLRGRAGRQGDPGLSRFYVSMEDSLMRLFASERVRQMMQSLGMQEDEAIEHRMVSNAIEKAQRKVEGRNFDIRKSLLEYDDVANDQRLVIYRQRNILLETDDIREIIANISRDVIESLVFAHLPPGSMEEQWDTEGLARRAAAEYHLQLPLEQWLADESCDPEQVAELAVAAFGDAYRDKFAELPEGLTLEQVERDIMLQNVDRLWRDHLSAMDHLRSAINLRQYAQKNPRQEYKREAFLLFQALLDNVKEQTVAALARLRLLSPEAIAEAEALQRAREEQLQSLMRARHNEPTAMLGGQDAPAGAAATGTAGAAGVGTFVRRGDKVGRNDPCPCGSGKKYKRCHGS